MACTLVESYLYAYPKVGYARNRSRTACFNEGFLKQAILGSKKLAEERVDNLQAVDAPADLAAPEGSAAVLRRRWLPTLALLNLLRLLKF